MRSSRVWNRTWWLIDCFARKPSIATGLGGELVWIVWLEDSVRPRRQTLSTSQTFLLNSLMCFHCNQRVNSPEIFRKQCAKKTHPVRLHDTWENQIIALLRVIEWSKHPADSVVTEVGTWAVPFGTSQEANRSGTFFVSFQTFRSFS